MGLYAYDFHITDTQFAAATRRYARALAKIPCWAKKPSAKNVPNDENDLEAFLRNTVERCEGMGIYARVRVRIPPDASAGEFVHLAMRMERAGVRSFNVAVFQPGAPWI